MRYCQVNITIYYSTTTDHLGSICQLIEADGTVGEQTNYDPWGRIRNLHSWQYDQSARLNLIPRGYTGHEMLREFGLINMNGRVYDPLTSRFLSPDNFVQSPNNPQNYNRYSYALNNPLKYVDPSGEIFWVPVIIGAVIGGYVGYKVADAKRYDFNDWQMYGYMLGGAVIGGLSGALGAEVAAAGGFMANTTSMIMSSYTFSVGMAALSNGMIHPSVNFGFGSYDFETGELNYLFDGDNKWYEDVGYFFGAMANLQDMVAFLRGGGENIYVNSASTKKGHEWWGHSSITDEKGNRIISVGPGESGVEKTGNLYKTWKGSIQKAKNWDTYYGESGTWSIRLNNVSKNALDKYANTISRWDIFRYSCVGHTTRALWRAGVITIYAFHPHMLNLQLTIRQIGIYSNPYLYQIP